MGGDGKDRFPASLDSFSFFFLLLPLTIHKVDTQNLPKVVKKVISEI